MPFWLSGVDLELRLCSRALQDFTARKTCNSCQGSGKRTTPKPKDDAESGSDRDGPLLDSVRPGGDAERPESGRLRLGRSGGGRGQAQVQSRAAAEPRGEAAAAEGHGQVPLRARHQGAHPRGGVQRGLRGAAEITAHPAPGQEALQDRDPQTGHLLHLLSQSRAGRLEARGSLLWTRARA